MQVTETCPAASTSGTLKVSVNVLLGGTTTVRRGPVTSVCPTRHDHADRERSPGTRRTVPQADPCTATRRDLVRATSPTPGPHQPPSSARSPRCDLDVTRIEVCCWRELE